MKKSPTSRHTGSPERPSKDQNKTNKNNGLKKITATAAKPPVVVRRSPIHGRGVFAARRIAKGERILEYTGERISHAEADRRYADLHENSAHTMLFAATDELVIDATRRGGPARWINHCCVPNCEANEEEGRVFIDAIRTIAPGEELSYDYNLVLEERYTPKLKREHPCYCGARRCRGTLLGKKR
jgi:SET domain-containing protein